MRNYRVALSLCLAAQVGCVSAPEPEPKAPLIEYPVWIEAGTSYDAKEQLLMANGSGSGRNASFAKSEADRRARAELSKVFGRFASELVKRWADKSGGPAVHGFARELSSQTLGGVQITDHWVHPTDGTVFAHAELSIQGFKDVVAKMKIGDEPKAFFIENADAVLKEVTAR